MVGLIGGEPLIHEKFCEFIDILIKDKKIPKVMLYTNGLLIDKYINKLSNKKINILMLIMIYMQSIFIPQKNALNVKNLLQLIVPAGAYHINQIMLLN